MTPPQPSSSSEPSLEPSSTPQTPSHPGLLPDAALPPSTAKRQPGTNDFLAISLFWLAVSFFWGAMLSVVLQSRVQTIVERENPVVVKQAALYKRPDDKPRSTSPTTTPNARNTTQSVTRPSVALAADPVQKQAIAARQELDSQAAGRLSWILGAGALVAAVTQMLFGAISDHSHHRAGRRKPFLIVGVLLLNIALLLFPFVRSYAALFGVFLLMQFFLNVASGPYQALLPDIVPAQYHGKASAYMGMFQLVGRTGGMVAGGVLLQYGFGLSVLTIIFAILLNGLMIVTASLTHEEPLAPDMSTHAARPGVLSSIRESFQVDLRGQASYVWVLVSRFVINIGVYTILPFLQYYLINAFDLTKTEALKKQVMIALIVNISGLAGTFPAGAASDRMSKKLVVYWTCALSIAGGLGFALSGSITYALISAAVFGLGYGAFQAVDWALVYNVLPQREPAKYMGLWGFADTIPQIIAPLLGGAIAATVIARYDANIGYRAIMMAAIIWFALGTFFIRFVRERVVAPSNQTASPQTAIDDAAPA